MWFFFFFLSFRSYPNVSESGEYILTYHKLHHSIQSNDTKHHEDSNIKSNNFRVSMSLVNKYDNTIGTQNSSRLKYSFYFITCIHTYIHTVFYFVNIFFLWILKIFHMKLIHKIDMILKEFIHKMYPFHSLVESSCMTVSREIIMVDATTLLREYNRVLFFISWTISY